MNNEDILKEAKKRHQDGVDSDQDNREQAIDDLGFVIGEGQWPEDVKTAREEAGRPMITVNRMPQFLRQVTGDIRRTNPAIDVIPADSDASSEVAEIYSGLTRQIEHECDASSIYEAAAESAAACGMGYWRILTDYDEGSTFDQIIKMERVPNPFSVVMDPLAKDPTRKDAEWMLITEQMDKDAFTEMYPKAKGDDWEDPNPEYAASWSYGETVLVAEYFWKERGTKKIGLTADGQFVEGKQVAQYKEMYGDEYIVKERDAEDIKIKWCKLTGAEVIEGPQEIPGRFIPIIAVMGEEINLGDRTYRSSVIRHAKDAQRLYNYSRSAQIELIALQPKAPFLVTTNQVKGLEAEWAGANTSNKAYLPYNADPKAAPPQRSQPPVPSAGFSQEIALAADDMQATTGIYNAGLGQRSNETSGVAIRQRQLEGDISTSIYVDNLSKAIAHGGRIIAEWIPIYYDTERVVRILGKDDVEKMVVVNQQMQTQYGLEEVNNLKLGRYDVRITTGPNYTTKRQETAESMEAFITAFPQAAPIIGDLYAKNLDWPGADEIAERLKKIVPEGIIEEEDLPPEQMQAKQMAMQQQQAAQQQAQEMQQAADQADVQKSMAEAEEADADAKKAQLEVMEKQLELSLKNGQINAVIQQEVARAIQQMLQSQQPAMAPQPQMLPGNPVALQGPPQI